MLQLCYKKQYVVYMYYTLEKLHIFYFYISRFLRWGYVLFVGGYVVGYVLFIGGVRCKLYATGKICVLGKIDVLGKICALGKIDIYIIVLPLVVHIEQVLNCGGGGT